MNVEKSGDQKYFFGWSFVSKSVLWAKVSDFGDHSYLKLFSGQKYLFFGDQK